MRIAAKLISGVCSALCLAALPAGAAAANAAPQPGGITVAPAALQLALRKGQQQATTTFNVTNTYSAPVTLSFSLELPTSDHTGSAPRPEASIANPLATIQPGDTLAQTLALRDTARLEPGSRQMDMVIAQQGASGNTIGVLSGIRLPVTIIKYDGAVTSLGLTNIASPGFAMAMPRTITVSLKNTGNMVTVPHGTVYVLSPGGTLVGKGTLNEPSKAIAPGDSTSFTTTIIPLASATVPGNYRVTVSYGLGGDSGVQSKTKSFIYVAWWHMASLGATAGLGWLLSLHGRRFAARRRHTRKQLVAAKRPVLIGRDIT